MSTALDANKPHTFSPSDVPKPPPTYDQVAVTPITSQSKLITLAGQVGQDAKTGNMPTDFVEQVKLAYLNVFNCLKAAGATPRDIIHVRHYIVKDSVGAAADDTDVFDRGWGPLWMEFMGEHADGHRPPDTVLGVACLANKNILYEVEVWAMVNQ